MKRGFYTMIITLALSLTACSQQPVNDASVIRGDEALEQVSATGDNKALEQVSSSGDKESEEKASSETDQYENEDIGSLAITLVGNDKAKITITSEEVVSVLQSEDWTGSVLAYFYLGETQILNIDMDCYGWNYYVDEDMANGEDIYYDNQDEPYTYNGDEVSFEIAGADVGYWLSQCDSYGVMVFADTGEDDGYIVDGYMEDIISYEDSDGVLEVTFIGDSEVIIHIEGAVLDGYSNSDEIKLLNVGFYPPESYGFLADYDLDIAYYTDGVVSSQFYIIEHVANEVSETQTNWTSSIVDSCPCETIANEQDIQVRIQFPGIVEGVSKCSSVVLQDPDSEAILLSTSIDHSIEEGDMQIPELPEVFGVSARDEDFFYPVTDDYMVMMIELPCVPVFEFAIGYPFGSPVYLPVYAHEEPLKVVTIISYSDFGIVDQRTKFIYQSADSMKVGSCGRLDWCDAVDFTGNAEHDDVLISDFLEYMDYETYGNSMDSSSESYVYYGYDDNVRYFKANPYEIASIYASLPNIDYDRDSEFDKDGFIETTLPYTEDFPDFDMSSSELREYNAQITLWASDACID